MIESGLRPLPQTAQHSANTLRQVEEQKYHRREQRSSRPKNAICSGVAVFGELEVAGLKLSHRGVGPVVQ